MLRRRPELIGSAVEEILRFESPVQLGNRKLAADAGIGGERLAKGTYVWLAIGAANRDPEVFEDPDSFDITRKPNRHLAFGAGIHVCAGMSLGRMEATVALDGLVRRFAEIERVAEARHHMRARFRGFTSYPVRAA